MDRHNLAYWSGLSGKWSVSPPLAPVEDDLAWFRRQIHRLGEAPLHVLLFGVTPGLATLAWPRGTTLVALDWSSGMLRDVFPRQGVPPGGGAVRADWRELPIASASCDFILGDGCYTALGDLQGAQLFNAEMARVLKPGGRACFRCFARPPHAATAEELFAALEEKPGGQLFDLFRWQLAIAVQGLRWGVALGEVWSAWDERVPERAALAARQGWSLDDLHRIERWKGEHARYAFPSLEALRDVASGQFRLLEVDLPSYALGECFPRIVLQARR
jgi:SAM-dependent methyltransferase